jgi:hypothetical protein
MSINQSIPELTNHREWFYEAMGLRGYPLIVYTVQSLNRDHENDPNPVFNPGVSVNGIFEQYPARKVLQNLGWYSEGEENPPIAYLPVYYLDTDGNKVPLKPEKYTKIDIVYNISGSQDIRSFWVMELAYVAPEIIYWTVRLAPYRPKNQFVPQTDPGLNYTYLKVNG